MAGGRLCATAGTTGATIRLGSRAASWLSGEWSVLWTTAAAVPIHGAFWSPRARGSATTDGDDALMTVGCPWSSGPRSGSESETSVLIANDAMSNSVAASPASQRALRRSGSSTPVIGRRRRVRSKIMIDYKISATGGDGKADAAVNWWLWSAERGSKVAARARWTRATAIAGTVAPIPPSSTSRRRCSTHPCRTGRPRPRCGP